VKSFKIEILHVIQCVTKRFHRQLNQSLREVRRNFYLCLVLICYLCCQRYSTEDDLYVYGTRVYECHFWERGFSKQDLLTNHIDCTHDRPHPFQHCDQKFSTKEDLQLHIPVHTGQSCPYCSQVFPLRNELLKHVAHAHADEDLSESNAKCWPEFAYHVHVRDGNAKISY